MNTPIDWHKVGYWEGVRFVLRIFAPFVAMGALFTVALRWMFSDWLISAWGLFALAMVVAWVYGLWVCRGVRAS